ncbi:MAG: hypothetical protein LBN09_03700 [Clostridioides sp.]|nr:hypothetical protein [Clostridioides sp.]
MCCNSIGRKCCGGLSECRNVNVNINININDDSKKVRCCMPQNCCIGSVQGF